MYRCYFLSEKKEIIDDGMFVFMKTPHSYTGENYVEFHTHGNPYLLNKILGAIVKSGEARKALPGEFSFRAFQNGKMDLSQVEAVADLIASESYENIKASAKILKGEFKRSFFSMKENLVNILAQVELDIDFSDQDISTINYEKIAKNLEIWLEKVNVLCRRYEETIPLREGISTIFVGAPNSGKSTLFNRLLGEDRSIVSKTKGTTRDVVKEKVYFKDLLLLLSDTAGIRTDPGPLEKEGIVRSYGELDKAQLVFLLIGLKDKITKGDFWEEEEVSFIREMLKKLYSINRKAKIFLLLNKIDRIEKENIDDFKQLFLSRLSSEEIKEVSFYTLPISAKEGLGLGLLKEKVLESFSVIASPFQEEGTEVTRKRHYHLLQKASERIKQAIYMIREDRYSPDILCQELRMALDFMGEITGEVSSEDLLNHIFSNFCIGK